MCNGELKISKEILEAFDFKGNVINVETLGNGIINDTFLVNCEFKKYVLQRINHNIFRDIEKLMGNYCNICSFLKREVIKNGGDVDRETITVVNTKKSISFYKDSLNNYWRAIEFIPDTITYDVIEQAEDFYKTGKAFGNFQKLLSNFDANTLYESIPDFHNTKERYKNFIKSVKEDKVSRVEIVKAEIDFIVERKSDTNLLLDMYEKGQLPLRVTHNDTKISNILLDKNTKEGICVIDLDTVMPGLSLYDFGDAIRSGATKTLEDEKDLDKVYIDLELFEAFTKGFLEGAGSILAVNEIKMLPMAAKVIALEQAIRFLTDYLEGDVYYKTSYVNQNLDRTRTQLKLVKDIEDKWDKLNSIVEKYS